MKDFFTIVLYNKSIRSSVDNVVEYAKGLATAAIFH